MRVVRHAEALKHPAPVPTTEYTPPRSECTQEGADVRMLTC